MSNLRSLAARLYHLLRPPVCVANKAIRLVEGMSRAIVRRPGSQKRDDGACARRGSGATIMRAELLLGRRMVSESVSRAPTDLAHAQGEWVEVDSPHAESIVPGWENRISTEIGSFRASPRCRSSPYDASRVSVSMTPGSFESMANPDPRCSMAPCPIDREFSNLRPAKWATLAARSR
jgi:hypothetical protein